MRVQAIQTPIFHPGDDLISFILESARARIQERTILAVTSKIVSLWEGRFLQDYQGTKEELVKRESDYFFGEIGYGCFLTIKNGLLIPSAGIDESNCENIQYILYPVDPFKSAREIWAALRKELQIQDLGIILTDSHTQPLRRGVIGAALSYWGFHGVKNLVGTPDLFGRELKMTNIDVADALAASATLLMGEGNERCPLAIIEDMDVRFSDFIDPKEIQIPPEEDLYAPFFKKFQT